MKKNTLINLVENRSSAGETIKTADFSSNPQFLRFRENYLQNGNLGVSLDTSSLDKENASSLALSNVVSNKLCSFSPTDTLPLDGLIPIQTGRELCSKAITIFRSNYDAEGISALRDMTDYTVFSQSTESRAALTTTLAKKLFCLCIVNGYYIHPDLDFNSLNVITEAIRYIDNQNITASFMDFSTTSNNTSDHKNLPSCFTTTQSVVLPDVKPLILTPISLPAPNCTNTDGDEYSKIILDFFKKVTPPNRLRLLQTIMSLLSTSLIGFHTYNSYRVTNSINIPPIEPSIAETLKQEIKVNLHLLIDFIKELLVR